MKLKKLVTCILVWCIIVTITFFSVFSVYADISLETNDTVTSVTCNCCGALEDNIVPILDSTTSNMVCTTEEYIPSSVDLSESDSFPCIRDQGNSNS